MFAPAGSVLYGISLLIACLTPPAACLVFVFRTIVARRRRKQPTHVLAFFHPYCSGGGGGERVLWKMIQVLADMATSTEYQSRKKPLTVLIYTIDRPAPDYQQKLLQDVHTRFSIDLKSMISKSGFQLEFVHLHNYVHLLQPSPRLSLLVESFRTMQLAWVALNHRSTKIKIHMPDNFLFPDWWIDTTGCAFTFPIAWLFHCRILAYVHYPTISTDMLQLVWEQRPSYNHDIQNTSRLRTFIKLCYYVLFAVLYGCVGSLATYVMVNSQWTKTHIQSLWKGLSCRWRGTRSRLQIVYPPCRDIPPLSTLKNQTSGTRYILSIGQFRPEKDHALQLHALATYRQKYRDTSSHDLQLVMVGGCRNRQDELRLQELKQLAERLEIDDAVQFVVSQPYDVVLAWLKKSYVGIHTMWNEHFGIGVVEMMAAGLLMIAHNSGGPKSDIITPKRTGFLASTADEYANAIHQALLLDASAANTMRQRANVSAQRFSDQVFCDSFSLAVDEMAMIV